MRQPSKSNYRIVAFNLPFYCTCVYAFIRYILDAKVLSREETETQAAAHHSKYYLQCEAFDANEWPMENSNECNERV